MREVFRKFAQRISKLVGTPVAFALAVFIILVWIATGPLFGFSDTWQLIINTGTTIVTFLIVFLIQNTQNRSDEATQLKLDELIKAAGRARKELIDLEDLSDKEIDRLEKQFREMRSKESGGD